jgi:hypothetical protein
MTKQPYVEAYKRGIAFGMLPAEYGGGALERRRHHRRRRSEPILGRKMAW